MDDNNIRQEFVCEILVNVNRNKFKKIVGGLD